MSTPSNTLPTVVHHQIDQRTKQIALIGVVGAILLSLAALIMVLRQPAPPVFVSVSVKALIEEHMMSVVGRDISQSEAELRTLEFVGAVEASIGELAASDGVIVIASEAVLGPSVPDFTNDIRFMAHERATSMATKRGAALPPLGDVSGYETMLGDMQRETKALTAGLRDGTPSTPAEDAP